MKPTIVIPAYNRPHSLARLLGSLEKAIYPSNVRLVVSVDVGGKQQKAVEQVAKEFDWSFGKKEVIIHKRPLGLIGNFLFCGGLTQEYGCTIHLEDDLVVSPAFYAYAQQLAGFYAEDPRVAGISLNALGFNGYTQYPFVPYLDGNDVFFMQVAWFHGQVYTKDQWSRFTEWYKVFRPKFHELNELVSDSSESLAQTTQKMAKDVPFHEMFDSFPETDWFPHKTRYLAETGRFYLFPRVSYATNFGDVGTHFEQQTRFFQTPLQMKFRELRLDGWEESTAVYDSFQELLPSRLYRLAPQLDKYDLTIDLHNNKSLANIRTEYVLTSKQSRQPVMTFGDVMWPLVANVVEEVQGTGLCISRAADLNTSTFARLKTEWMNVRYVTRGREVSYKQRWQYKLGHWVNKLR